MRIRAGSLSNYASALVRVSDMFRGLDVFDRVYIRDCFVFLMINCRFYMLEMYGIWFRQPVDSSLVCKRNMNGRMRIDLLGALKIILFSRIKFEIFN